MRLPLYSKTTSGSVWFLSIVHAMLYQFIENQSIGASHCKKKIHRFLTIGRHPGAVIATQL